MKRQPAHAGEAQAMYRRDLLKAGFASVTCLPGPLSAPRCSGGLRAGNLSDENQEYGAYMATTFLGKFEGMFMGPVSITWEPDQDRAMSRRRWAAI